MPVDDDHRNAATHGAAKQQFAQVPMAFIVAPGLSHAERTVFVALCLFAGSDYRCWPGARRLSDCGVGPSHISRITGALEAKGWIRIRRPSPGEVANGRPVTNEYDLSPAWERENLRLAALSAPPTTTVGPPHQEGGTPPTTTVGDPPPPRWANIPGEQTSQHTKIPREILAVWNEVFGRRMTFDAWGAKIVAAVRCHPELDVDAHRRIIEHEFASGWWRGADRPVTPGLIYGSRAQFERCLSRMDSPTAAEDRTSRLEAGLEAAFGGSR